METLTPTETVSEVPSTETTTAVQESVAALEVTAPVAGTDSTPEITVQKAKRTRSKVNHDEINALAVEIITSGMTFADFLRSKGVAGDKKLAANLYNTLKANGTAEKMPKAKRGRKAPVKTETETAALAIESAPATETETASV